MERKTTMDTMLTPQDGDKEFRTSDTPLAAYLLSEGFNLLDIDYSNTKRFVFVFANDSKKLADFTRQYHLAKARGNIVSFFSAYKHLLFKIRNGLPV